MKKLSVIVPVYKNGITNGMNIKNTFQAMKSFLDKFNCFFCGKTGWSNAELFLFSSVVGCYI